MHFIEKSMTISEKSRQELAFFGKKHDDFGKKQRWDTT